MRLTPHLFWLALPVSLTACSKGFPSEDEPLVVGTVTVCTDVAPDDGQAHDVSGTVVAIDAAASDCTHTITIEDADGVQHVVGWTVERDDGMTLTYELDLAEGDAVDLRVRSVLVWGDVQGFVLHDADGLVVAVDEGTWGGALEPDDTGVGVAHGTLLQTEAGDCETLEYARILFDADVEMETDPVETRLLPLDGVEYMAMGVASITRGPGESCEITDQTDELSWIIWR